jgi:DNA-binding NtrC family response regulator
MEIRHIFPSEPSIGESADETSPSFQEATRKFQRGLLEETLLATQWNVSETARRLDLARSHVYNLIHSFGLNRRNAREEPEA